MGNATLDRYSAERSKHEDFIAELLNQADTEGRDLVSTELENIEKATGRIEELDAQIRRIAEFEQRRAAGMDLSKITSGGPRAVPGPVQAQVETRSLGEIFTDSEEFRSWDGRGNSPVVRIPEFRAVGPDPLLTTTKPGSDLIRSPYKYYAPLAVPRNPLLSYVGRVEVGGATSIDWVVRGIASGADRVAEGAAKPPIVCTTTTASLTLSPVAGWCKFSRNALRSIPALRSMIDEELRLAIDAKLAEEAVAEVKKATAAVTGAAGASLAEVVRQAIADLEMHGITPTALLANPEDVAKFDILMLGKPLGVATVQGGMWGVPIVPVPGLTAGTAYVGDISRALKWFHNEGLEIYTTDSDISGEGATAKSDFRTNILTALAEVFGIFGLVDQSAIRKVVVTP